MMKIYSVPKIFGFLLLCVVMLPQGSVAEPNELLGQAIKNSAELKKDKPTKERLALYEQIFIALDKITNEHGSSDQAIKILSGQKIGDFDPSELSANYITELSEYYDTVCETSPSFACLGFVSLKTGRDQCVGASTAETLVEAHENILNAAEIFIGQKEKDSFISLAMGEYRKCLSMSEYEVTEHTKDYFASLLLDVVLSIDQVSTAKAVIENMTTPAFKFDGVLKLSKHQDKAFDEKFMERLTKYIAEKVENENGNAAISNILLVNSAVTRASFEVDYGMAYDSVQQYRRWGTYAESCHHFFSRALFETLTELQSNLISLPEDRKKFNKAQAPKLMLAIAERPNKVLSACKKDGYYDYFLMTLIYGQLLLFDQSTAEEFLSKAVKEYWSDSQQLRFAVEKLGSNPELLETNLNLKESGPFPELDLDKIFNHPKAKLPLFEKRVDFAQVCEAATILFQELKGTPAYDDAVKYMINSPSIDPSEKYECGDEELELLLN